MHVHLREPGHEYKETIATGTRAAARRRLHGGRAAWRTPSPVNDSARGHRVHPRRARSEGGARVYPDRRGHARPQGRGSSPRWREMRRGRDRRRLRRRRPVMNAALMRRALEYARRSACRSISHEEDAHLARRRRHERGRRRPPARPPRHAGGGRGGDGRARHRCSRELTGAHVHIAHLSHGGRRAPGARGARRGAPRDRRGDAAPPRPHRGGRRAATTPTPRWRRRCARKRDVEALREALADGTIDCHRHRPCPARRVREGGRVRHGRVRHRRARDRARACCSTPGAARVLPTAHAGRAHDASVPRASSACPAARSPRAPPADLTLLDLDAARTRRARALPLARAATRRSAAGRCGARRAMTAS